MMTNDAYNSISTLDSLINKFIAAHNIVVGSINLKGCPERSLEWHNQNGIACLIQIYLNSNQKTFRVWLCGYQDKNGHRYWTQLTKAKDLLPPFNLVEIESILEESFQWLENVDETQLEVPQ